MHRGAMLHYTCHLNIWPTNISHGLPATLKLGHVANLDQSHLNLVPAEKGAQYANRISSVRERRGSLSMQCVRQRTQTSCKTTLVILSQRYYPRKYRAAQKIHCPRLIWDTLPNLSPSPLPEIQSSTNLSSRNPWPASPPPTVALPALLLLSI